MTTHDSFCSIWIGMGCLCITFELFVSIKQLRNKGIYITRWIFLMTLDCFGVYELLYKLEIAESIQSKSWWFYLLMLILIHYFYSMIKLIIIMADGATAKTNN